MSVLLLVRHAQATFGLGTYDKLSEHGQLQARHLGQTLAQRGVRIDRVVSGELDRQRETADLVAGALGIGSVAIDPRWNEYEHMPLITRVRPSYRKHWMMVADLAKSGNPNRRLQEIIDQALGDWVAEAGEAPRADAPAGDDGLESFGAYWGRAAAGLGEAAAGNGTTLVVSSAGTIAAAVAPLVGIGPAAWPALHRVMVNTSVTKVVRGQRGISLISFNEHGHLDGAPGVKITYR